MLIGEGPMWCIVDHKFEKKNIRMKKNYESEKRKKSGAHSGKYPPCPCLPLPLH
jgi:hypothetical protein